VLRLDAEQNEIEVRNDHVLDKCHTPATLDVICAWSVLVTVFVNPFYSRHLYLTPYNHTYPHRFDLSERAHQPGDTSRTQRIDIYPPSKPQTSGRARQDGFLRQPNHLCRPIQQPNLIRFTILRPTSSSCFQSTTPQSVESRPSRSYIPC
jgi:hypothetical protein